MLVNFAWINGYPSEIMSQKTFSFGVGKVTPMCLSRDVAGQLTAGQLTIDASIVT